MSELHAACLSCPNNLGAIRLRDQHMDLQKSYNQSESSRTALNVNLADIKAMYAKDLNDIENEYTVRIAFLEKALSIKDELNEALREKTSTLEAQLAEAENIIDELVLAMSTWRPIETAPKDGTKILLFGCYLNPVVFIGFWEKMIKVPDRWRDTRFNGGVPRNPSHWMPLPEPPTSKTECEK